MRLFIIQMWWTEQRHHSTNRIKNLSIAFFYSKITVNVHFFFIEIKPYWFCLICNSILLLLCVLWILWCWTSISCIEQWDVTHNIQKLKLKCIFHAKLLVILFIHPKENTTQTKKTNKQIITSIFVWRPQTYYKQWYRCWILLVRLITLYGYT